MVISMGFISSHGHFLKRLIRSHSLLSKAYKEGWNSMQEEEPQSLQGHTCGAIPKSAPWSQLSQPHPPFCSWNSSGHCYLRVFALGLSAWNVPSSSYSTLRSPNSSLLHSIPLCSKSSHPERPLGTPYRKPALCPVLLGPCPVTSAPPGKEQGGLLRSSDQVTAHYKP